jgi:hypothetical protein
LQAGFYGPQVERPRAPATIEDIHAQRVEGEVERHPEIAGEVCSGDLQPVRFQIVDEKLAEPAFLANLLLAGKRARGGACARGTGYKWLVVVFRIGAAAVGIGTAGGAFDETLVEPELAVLADRHDDAGAGAVFRRIDRLGFAGLNELVATGFAFRGFIDQPLGPGIVGERLEFGETVLDVLQLGRDRRRELGGFRAETRILARKAVIGIEHRPHPRPMRAQFLGLGFELGKGETADQWRVVEKPVVVAAEEVAGDSAAGRLVSRRPDKRAKMPIERDRTLGQQPPYRIGLDVGLVLDLAPHRELGFVVGAERKRRHHLERELAGAVFIEQFRRHLAELQALLDMPLADPKAAGDRRNVLAGLDQPRHRREFVGRVHLGAHRVFEERGFARCRRLLGQARYRVTGREDALGGERLQGLEAAAAGRYGKEAAPLG